MEKVITCPVCKNTDNCFEEVQETFSSYLCFSCGFMSDSRYEIGSLKLIDNLKNSPKFVRESQFEDIQRNIVWFPSVINMGKLGMIYPEGTKYDYVWKYAKLVDIPEEEQSKYPDPNNPGTFYKKRMDMENMKRYDKLCFMDAAEDLGMFKKEFNNEN